MNCRRRGHSAGADVKPIKGNETKTGDAQSYGDKHGMERHSNKPPKPMKSGEVVEHPA
jgi:hypothetical protein